MTITIPSGRTLPLQAKSGGGFQSSALAVPSVGLALVDNEDGTVTLTGTGFGNTGPIFVCNFDAANATSDSGFRFDALDAILGTGVSIDTPDSLLVEAEAKLPGGKGIVIGSNRLDLNGGITATFNVDYPASRKCFESRTTYFPRDHAELAVDYRLGNLADPDPEGSSPNDDWQMKPVWNFADRDDGGSDTDFFFTTFERWFTPANGVSRVPRITSNSVAGSIAELSGSSIAVDQYKSVNIPLDEPLTTEVSWDQGPLETSINQGTIWHQAYYATSGVQSEGTDNNVNLAEVNGPTKEINGFGYPGFIRGFSQVNDNHLLETQIFRQVGDGRYCRIALCNSANYFTSTVRILLPVQLWSDTQIDASLPAWSAGLTDFVGYSACVIDIDNNQIGSGVEIT